MYLEFGEILLFRLSLISVGSEGQLYHSITPKKNGESFSNILVVPMTIVENLYYISFPLVMWVL